MWSRQNRPCRSSFRARTFPGPGDGSSNKVRRRRARAKVLARRRAAYDVPESEPQESADSATDGGETNASPRTEKRPATPQHPPPKPGTRPRPATRIADQTSIAGRCREAGNGKRGTSLICRLTGPQPETTLDCSSFQAPLSGDVSSMKSSLPLLVAGLALLAGDAAPPMPMTRFRASSSFSASARPKSPATASCSPSRRRAAPSTRPTRCVRRVDLHQGGAAASRNAGDRLPHAEQELAEAKEKEKQCYTAKRESGDYRKRPKPS